MLEIGTIVILKDGKQKLMIVNRLPIIEVEEKKVYFDYSACPYPIGISGSKLLYFNNENISKILYKGFHDEDEENFLKLNEEILASKDFVVEKGKVSQSFE